MEQKHLDNLITYLMLDYSISVNYNERKRIIKRIEDNTIFFIDGTVADSETVDIDRILVIDVYTGTALDSWCSMF